MVCCNESFHFFKFRQKEITGVHDVNVQHIFPLSIKSKQYRQASWRVRAVVISRAVKTVTLTTYSSPLYLLHCYSQVASSFTFISGFSVKLLSRRCQTLKQFSFFNPNFLKSQDYPMRSHPFVQSGIHPRKVGIILGLVCEKPCQPLYYYTNYTVSNYIAEPHRIFKHFRLYPILINYQAIPYLNTLPD